ncbi:ulp1 protease family, C-terminal catalytic domain-containing protein, partial [Tanacetum coccineum]
DVVFDDAFGRVGDENVVVGGVVVISSSLDMLTNSCLGGIMVEEDFSLRKIDNNEVPTPFLEGGELVLETRNRNGKDNWDTMVIAWNVLIAIIVLLEKDEKVIAIFKTPRKNHYASDSDDDFVKSPRQPILIRSKRKVREKKNESKKRQKIDNVSHSAKKYGKKGKTYPPVNRRHPPKCLIDSIKKFTDAQRERVKTMGFEHVLSLKIEKIPKKLGYWLVTNYDPETSSLNINGRSLLITKEVIHDVYGVPMGEVSDVIPRMLEDKEGGRKFQLNFLVLFVTVMIESISNGPVNQKFLANIEGDTVIHNLDWCSYTLDCLNESRKAWNRLDQSNFYTGPLLFLVVFYMSSAMLNAQDKVCGIIPSMNGWTTKHLKDRQRKEIKNGGFGKVIFSPNVQFLDDVEIVEAKNYEVAEKKVDTPITTENTNTNAPSFGTCKETMHESQSDMIVMIQNENTYRDGYYDKHNDYSTQEYHDIFESDDWGDEEPNDVGDEEMSLEDIVNEVKRNFSVITNAKALINENIFKGLDMFPNNKDLLTLAKEHDVLFGVSLSGNSDDCHFHQDDNANKGNLNDSDVEVPGILTQTITDHVIFDKILESSLSKASMKEAECKYKRLQPINIHFSEDGDEANGGNVCVLDSDSKSKTSEVTPEMVQDVVKKLDASKFKPFQNSLVSANNEEPKADKKGDDQKLVSVGISKSKIRPRSLNEIFLEKTRAKREVKIPDSLKSPYINRIVDCKRRLQLDEKKVSNWLFACTEDENDIVFEAHGQLIGYKGIMESLRPGSKIHASVIDIWVAIQNDMEKRRSTSASSRVFVHSDIMGEAMMNKRMSNARKCELFNTNLKACLKLYNHEKLKNIELVCFPIVQSGHFYYITFNLMKDEVHVIDNLTVCPNYKELPEKLISKFAGYLTEINHRKANSIRRVKPVRLEFTWQTTYNCVDCGVFLMRHMEIYKGMHKIENGLAREGLVQQQQLNDINEHKEALNRKVSIFDKLTRDQKNILNQHGLVVGESRVASFG